MHETSEKFKREAPFCSEGIKKKALGVCEDCEFRVQQSQDHPGIQRAWLKRAGWSEDGVKRAGETEGA